MGVGAEAGLEGALLLACRASCCCLYAWVDWPAHSGEAPYRDSSFFIWWGGDDDADPAASVRVCGKWTHKSVAGLSCELAAFATVCR